jgi:PQQ-like domain
MKIRARGVISASVLGALAPLYSQVSVLTNHYDNARTGANLSETQLNTSNVNVNQFGKLFCYAVDGSIYAQPLYLPAAAISGKGTHNVVYVATMNDKVYAFDADSNAGPNASPLWSVDFTNAASGITAIPITDLTGSNSLNIVGNVGVASTSVIDPGRQYDIPGRPHQGECKLRAAAPRARYRQRRGEVRRTGDDSGRAGLALANGLVIVSWASDEGKTTLRAVSSD